MVEQDPQRQLRTSEQTKLQPVIAVRREHLEPIPEGDPSWTTLVSDMMKEHGDEFLASLQSDSKI